MPLPQTYCPTNRTHLTASVQALAAFEVAVQEAAVASKPELATQPQAILTQAILTLEASISPFESELNLELQKQYNEQVAILTATELLIESLPESKLPGIIGIDGKEYPIPTFREVLFSMIEQYDTLKVKISQGFSLFTLIPFGLSIEQLAQGYARLIDTKHKAGELLDSKGEALPLNEQQPVWIWDKLLELDQVFYNPKAFDQAPAIHQGHTKPDLLQTPHSGWQVQLIENLPHIPRAGKATTVGDRPQLPTSITETDHTPFAVWLRAKGQSIPSPKDYLEWHLQETANPNSPYYNEILPTPESWLMTAITHLFKTNQALDDYQAGGSISWLPGCYTASDRLPYAYWGRGLQRARLSGIVPVDRADNYGVRSAVGVKFGV